MLSMLKNRALRVASPKIWMVLAFFIVAIIILRWPAFVNYSIDDVAKLTASETTSEMYKKDFLRWNRYIPYLFNSTIDQVAPLNHRTLSFGYFFMSAGLVAYLYALIRLFRLQGRIWSYLLIAYFVLFPILFILFHFTLIQFSIVFVFMALVGLIAVNSSGLKPVRIIISTAIATALIAGSYQSGLYFLFITLALLVYYYSRDMTSIPQLIRVCLYFGVGLVAGFIAYSLIGKIVGQFVPLRDNFSPRPISEWFGELISRKDHFLILNKGWSQMPGWEQQLAFATSLVLFAISFFSPRSRAPQKVAIVFIGLTFLLCYVQILTLPVEFNRKPVRSFWFIPMFLVCAGIVFMDRFGGSDKAWQNYIRHGATALTAFFAALFLHHTIDQSRGYKELRATDLRNGKYMLSEAQKINPQRDKPIVIAWSNIRKRNQYHRGTIGAMRSLFFAEWSKYRYLQTLDSTKLIPVTRKQRKNGNEKCSKSRHRDPLPQVTDEADYILACI